MLCGAFSLPRPTPDWLHSLVQGLQPNGIANFLTFVQNRLWRKPHQISEIYRICNFQVQPMHWIISSSSTHHIPLTLSLIPCNTNTVKWNRRLVCLWSKMSTFQTDFLTPNNAMLACLWPLLCSIPRVRAFKWGIVWRFIWRGIKTATTWRFGLSTLLNKSRLFGNF